MAALPLQWTGESWLGLELQEGSEEGRLEPERCLGKHRSASTVVVTRRWPCLLAVSQVTERPRCFPRWRTCRNTPEARPLVHLGAARTHQQRALCRVSPFSGWMQGRILFAGGSPREHSPSPAHHKPSQPWVGRRGQDSHSGFQEFATKGLIRKPL